MMELKEMPESLQTLIREKGWTWPPTPEMRQELAEALKRFSGTVKLDVDQAWWQRRGHTMNHGC